MTILPGRPFGATLSKGRARSVPIKDVPARHNGLCRTAERMLTTQELFAMGFSNALRHETSRDECCAPHRGALRGSASGLRACGRVRFRRLPGRSGWRFRIDVRRVGFDDRRGQSRDVRQRRHPWKRYRRKRLRRRRRRLRLTNVRRPWRRLRDGARKKCGCTPITCAQAGAQCGSILDGCGGTLDCKSCPIAMVCGGGGPNRCGLLPCVAKTCVTLGVECGPASDGCGKQLNCGSPCRAPQTCGGAGVAGKCGCTPKTCGALGKNCGAVPDGCGAMINCGTCTSPATCGGSGQANVCGCKPKTCGELGANCGLIGDGCGAMLDCGTCKPDQKCGVKQPNHCDRAE